MTPPPSGVMRTTIYPSPSHDTNPSPDPRPESLRKSPSASGATMLFVGSHGQGEAASSATVANDEQGSFICTVTHWLPTAPFAIHAGFRLAGHAVSYPLAAG